MTIEQTIKKAIEGGWKYSPLQLCYQAQDMRFPNGIVEYPLIGIFDDPLFWDALGKSLGWKKYTWTSWKGWDEHWIEFPTDEEEYLPPFENEYCQRHITTELMWHRFIEHRLERKTIKQFFEPL